LLLAAAVHEGLALLRTVFELSERRPCSIVKPDCKMARDRSGRPPDTALCERLSGLVAERRLFDQLLSEIEPSV